MFIAPILQQLFISLAVVTSMGTLVHDTKVDKAYQLSLPIVSNTVAAPSNFDHLTDSGAHTHVERVSVKQAFAGMPRIQPRNQHKRYYLPMFLSRNNTFFGDSNILIPIV